MVVTGFEIFGAVSGALGTLNLVRQLVASIGKFAADWGNSGHKILEIYNDFEIFVIRLEVWTRRTWLIDAQFTDDFGKAYWGEPGWRSIATQLGHIDKIAQDFLIIFKQAVDPGTIAELRPRYNSSLINAEEATLGNWWDKTGLNNRREASVRRLRELGRQLTVNLPPFQKAKIVIERSDVLSDLLTSLNARFLRLERDATAFFDVQHQAAPRVTSQQQRYFIAQSSLLRQNARVTKAGSEALYRACRDFTNEDCTINQSQAGNGTSKLEMNLLETDPSFCQTEEERNFRMRYQLVLSPPSNEDDIEVLAEGPLRLAAGDVRPPIDANFAEACSHIKRTGTGSQYFQPDSGMGNLCVGVFRLSSPVEPLKPCNTKSIHLFGLLETIRTMTSVEASGQFPLTERLTLAFKVAECGLLLNGTSWLSGLDSRNVQRLSDPEWRTKRRFLLELTTTDNEHLLSVEPHVFRIGVLLAEIAMGQAVERIAAYTGPLGIELDLVIAVQCDREWEMRSVPAVEIEQRVSRVMGPQYSRAVAFCLQQSVEARGKRWGSIIGTGSPEEENAYHELSAKFYDKVYLPLQKHQDLCSSES